MALGLGAYGKASIQVGSRRGLYVPSGAVVSDPTTTQSVPVVAT